MDFRGQPQVSVFASYINCNRVSLLVAHCFAFQAGWLSSFQGFPGFCLPSGELGWQLWVVMTCSSRVLGFELEYLHEYCKLFTHQVTSSAFALLKKKNSSVYTSLICLLKCLGMGA